MFDPGGFIIISVILASAATYIFQMWARHQRRLMIHRERLAAIEKGVELPPLEQEMQKRSWNVQRVLLLAGLVWISVGVASFPLLNRLGAYALTLARGDGRLGAELRAVPPCTPPPASPASPARRCGGFAVGGGSLKGIGVTMTQLAAELPSATEGRYVVDRTGLSGTFDVNLTWNADALSPTTTSADSPASIFAAIQEQLGLRLVSITTPIEVIVIDRADRPASN